MATAITLSMFKIVLVVVISVAVVFVVAPPPGPPQPPVHQQAANSLQPSGSAKITCPNDFVTKYKNASGVCEKEASTMSKLKVTDGKKAVVVVLDRVRRNEGGAKSDSDEANSENVVCSYMKLKMSFSQIANMEKDCTAEPAAGATTKASDKSSEEEDAETELANCLLEKMEAMCPELAAAV